MVERLLRQYENGVFPPQAAFKWRGRGLARLVREVDYQEMAGLMVAYLQQLVDRVLERDEVVEDYLAMLEHSRQERQAQREFSS